MMIVVIEEIGADGKKIYFVGQFPLETFFDKIQLPTKGLGQQILKQLAESKKVSKIYD